MKKSSKKSSPFPVQAKRYTGPKADVNGSTSTLSLNHISFTTGQTKLYKIFDSFYKTIPQPIIIYHFRGGEILFANAAFFKLFGTSRKEIINNFISNFFLQYQQGAERKELLNHLQKKKMPVVGSFSTKGGESIVARMQGGIITIGREKYCSIHIVDITDQKKYVAEIQKMDIHIHEIFNQISDAFIALDSNFRYTYVNRKAGEIFGLSPAKIIGKIQWEIFPATIDTAFYQACHTALTLQQYVYIEEYYQLFDRWYENHIYPSSSGISIYFRDITSKKKAELAVEEKNNALREAHLELQEIVEHASEIIFKIDQEGYFLFVSPEFQRSLGYTPEEVIGQHMEPFVHPDDYSICVHALKTTLETRKPLHNIIYRVKRKDGLYDWFSTSANFIFYEDGTPKYGIGLSQNITGLRNIVEKLEATEQRYEAFLEHSSEAIWRIEIPGGAPIKSTFEEILGYCSCHGYLAECNLSYARMYGYEAPDAMEGFRLSELMPIDDPGNLDYFIAFIQAGFKLTNAESVEFDKEGNRKYILNNLIGIIENEKLIRIWGTQRDITKLKDAEREISVREEQYRTLAENVPVMIYRMGRDFRFTYINNAVGETFNIQNETFIGKTPQDLGIENDKWETLREKGQKLFDTGIANSFTFKIPSGSIPGKEYNLLINLTPEKDETGHVYSIIAIANEITPIIKAQEELIYKDKLLSVVADAANSLLKEENYSAIIPGILENLGVETLCDRVYIFKKETNENGELIARQLFNWHSSLISKNVKKAKTPTLPITILTDRFKELKEGDCYANTTANVEHTELRSFLDDVGVLSFLLVPIRINQELWGFVGFEDCKKERVWKEADRGVLKTFASSLASAIERKKAGEVIMESEARFRHMADTAPVMIWVSDEDENTVYVNKNWIDFTGVSLDELNKNNWSSLVHPEDIHIAIQGYQIKSRQRVPVLLEYRLKNLNGEYRWVMDQSIPRFLSNGTFLGYIGSVIDIHDRKLTEEKISYQAMVLREVTEAIISTDLNLNVITWNKGAEMIHGITADKIIGKPLRSIVEYQYINETREDAWHRLDKTANWTGEVYYDRKDGRRIYLHSAISFITNNKGVRIGLVGIHRDITDRRKSEEALRISEERHRSVIQALGEGIILR